MLSLSTFHIPAIRVIRWRSSSWRARSKVPVFSNGQPALFSECSISGSTFLKSLFNVTGYPIAVLFAWRCMNTLGCILARIIA
ncbi:hypothetical protein PBCV1_a600R [Paramecium bursaria Chlorella virus 1]|uniref:Uncharacterized protein n=1 Tax=Paramecium bursaria Chlorella virus 1 TaxID=10506 RepID=O41082_PBCV1|nr:hypothetical protein PBCV1_a600R [Paramecium bursaria Chlorella virus 1]AAC97021.1 hypothetical protein [Paramecium bursaria Chlorella virus 1]